MQTSCHTAVCLVLFLVLENSYCFNVTKYPQNTAAVKGDTVLLECQPNDGDIDDLTWLYHGERTQVITKGRNVVPPFVHKVSLVYNNTTLLYNLKLNATAAGHVQQYSCGNNKSRGFADLIVLDAPPSCDISANLTDLIEGQTVTVHCIVAYESELRWNAVTDCRDDITGIIRPTQDSGSVDGTLTKRQFTIKANSPLQNHSYSCFIHFPAPPKYKDDSPQEIYSTVAPIYLFHYQTALINIHRRPHINWALLTAASIGGLTVLVIAVFALRQCICINSCHYCCNAYIQLKV